MSNRDERRRDLLTSQKITHALRLATEFGYDRARRHMEEAGIPRELATHMLLIRYDRRAPLPAVPTQQILSNCAII